MDTKIRVVLARINAKPPLRALADVTIGSFAGDITIKRCAVFEKSGQPPWATVPRIPIEKDGTKIFATLIDFSANLKARVLRAVLEAYRETPVENSLKDPLAPQGQSASSVTGPDNSRQLTAGGAGGPKMPGLEKRSAEKLRCKGRRRRPNLIHTDGITEKTEN